MLRHALLGRVPPRRRSRVLLHLRFPGCEPRWCILEAYLQCLLCEDTVPENCRERVCCGDAYVWGSARDSLFQRTSYPAFCSSQQDFEASIGRMCDSCHLLLEPVSNIARRERFDASFQGISSTVENVGPYLEGLVSCLW